MKEPYQPKAHGQDDGEHQDFAVIAKSALDGASDEAIGQVVEAKKLMRQIDGDGVHANPYKRPAPVMKAQAVDHVVEQCQEEKTVTPGHQHKRRSPDFLDNGELHAPGVAQRQTNEPAPCQLKGLFECDGFEAWRIMPANTPRRQLPIAGKVLNKPSGS